MRLVVCDDHRLLLDALSVALSDSGHTVVATALHPDQAVEAVREHQPDACLLDVYFPHGNGLNAIGPIHEVSPNTKVVMLSSSTSGGLVAEALAQGAAGFVGKENPIGVVIEALELALQGYLAVDPLVLRDALRPHPRDDAPLWVLKFLTGREWDVLRCLMEGLSTEEIADHLGVQRSTARTHVQNLLIKLGVHSRLQAAALMTTYASRRELAGPPAPSRSRAPDVEMLPPLTNPTWRRRPEACRMQQERIRIAVVDEHRVFAEAMASRLSG